MVKQKGILEQAAQIVDFSHKKTVKKRAKTGVFEQKTAILCLKMVKKCRHHTIHLHCVFHPKLCVLYVEP